MTVSSASGYESELKYVMRRALREKAGISVPVMLTEKKPMTLKDLSGKDEFLELFNMSPFSRRLHAFMRSGS